MEGGKKMGKKDKPMPIENPFTVKCLICNSPTGMIVWQFTPTKVIYFCVNCWKIQLAAEGKPLAMCCFKHDMSNDKEMFDHAQKDPEQTGKLFIHQINFLTTIGTILIKAVREVMDIEDDEALDCNIHLKIIINFLLARAVEEIANRVKSFNDSLTEVPEKPKKENEQ